jgi:hypothetical protein
MELRFPHCWKFTTTDGQSNMEEVVFTIHGIIVNMDLPPVKILCVTILIHMYVEAYRKNSQRRSSGFIRQSVQLTGLNTSSFQSTIHNIRIIHGMFECSFLDGALEQPSTTRYAKYECMDLNTRYLTSRKEDPTTQPVIIPHYIDPNGYLSSIPPPRTYFYGPENEVQYFQLRTANISEDMYVCIY